MQDENITKIDELPKVNDLEKEAVKSKEDSHNRSPHKCEMCGKTFRLASGLKTHSIKHGRKLKCAVCNKEFYRKLKSFIKTHRFFTCMFQL